MHALTKSKDMEKIIVFAVVAFLALHTVSIFDAIVNR